MCINSILTRPHIRAKPSGIVTPCFTSLQSSPPATLKHLCNPRGNQRFAKYGYSSVTNGKGLRYSNATSPPQPGAPLLDLYTKIKKHPLTKFFYFIFFFIYNSLFDSPILLFINFFLFNINFISLVMNI